MADNLKSTAQSNQPLASLEAVAPPSADAGSRGVSEVTLAYPPQVTVEYAPRFQQIIQDLPAAATSPDTRVRIADSIAAHNKETEVYRPNQQPQWGKVIINALAGDYNEAYKWFNGGGVKEVEARDLNNNVYFKEENELGATGRYKDNKGRLLTNSEIEALNQRGGVITKNDQVALQTAPWVNGKYNSTLANQALTSQLQRATNDAYNSARVAGGANLNLDEQLKIASGMRNVLDHISSLPADRRKALLGNVSRLNQIGSTAGTSQERRLGSNVGGSTTETRGANVGVGVGGNSGGVTGGGGIAPPGRGAVDAGISASNTGTTQTGATGGAANTGTTGASQMQQEQQNLERIIYQELQGVITSPLQFQQFMRLQALNTANYAAYNNIPAHVLPPTWNMVPETDVYSGGADRMIANLVNQQRNNAMLAAWSKTLYQSSREMAKTGQRIDVDTASGDFQKSEIFNAINNTYKYKLESQLSGKLIPPPRGTKMVNGRNQIVTYGE